MATTSTKFSPHHLNYLNSADDGFGNLIFIDHDQFWFNLHFWYPDDVLYCSYT